MYNLSDIKVIHLEPTSKCQARCAQCGRYDFDDNGKMIINPLVTDRNGKCGALDEISLSDFVRWFPPSFAKQLERVYMCGTFGEPTLATDCFKIMAYLRLQNPKMELTIHTNGGCNSEEWWQKIAKIGVKVVFGIDGLEDTHSLYRVNTNWRKIIKNARAFIRAGGYAEWQMLVFKHNEHQISKCAKLSKMLGFKTFRYEHTSRFGENGTIRTEVVNPKGEITHYLEPSSVSLKHLDSSIDNYFEAQSKGETCISCISKERSEIYVAANGRVLPCCHMESCFMYNSDDIEDYQKKINVTPNLHQQSLKEIFDSLYFRRIQKSWNDDPLLICSKTCGVTKGWLPTKTTQESGSINF